MSVIDNTHQAKDVMDKPAHRDTIYIPLPTDRFLELEPLADWVHQELSSRPYLKKDYSKLSSEQQQLVIAVTLLASERESMLLAQINRDFVDTLTRMARWAKGILHRPIFSDSSSRGNNSRKKSGGSNGSGGSGGGPGTNSYAGGDSNSNPPWLARWVNIQNTILAIGFILASIFGGLWTYQKIRATSLESTISALEGNLDAIDRNETGRQQEISDLRKRADDFQDKLANAHSQLQEIEYQNASLTAENKSLAEETARIRSEIERIRAEASQEVDVQITKLTSERDEIQKLLDAERKLKAEFESKSSIAEAQIAILNNQNEQLRTVVDSSSDTIGEYRDKEVGLVIDRQLFELAQLALGDIEDEVKRWGNPNEDELERIVKDYKRRAEPHLKRRNR